jgi:hypothetical protein
MAIVRENIISLIGSRRYHSAILTTYSFDFFFFEMKAMRWLRSCGVRNVNVLIDGYYYSELMQQICGEEMQLSSGYSLYPIFQKTVFHPKIWLLIGKNEGLLIVGSGNLTNAGNGNNDEIWGAFHFDIRFTDNSEIFSAAWQYVQKLCSSLKGLTSEKTNRWITDHAKWLNELPVIKPFQFLNTSEGEKIAFLYNDDISSIWPQLINLLGKNKITEITAISPFYDLDGKAIQTISTAFPSAKINIVIDEAASVPEKLPTVKAYTFYDWYKLGISKTLHSKSENTNTQSKLHAKIIHFKTNTNKEFCLFGSANITSAGLGIVPSHANSEVSLFLQSENGSLLNKLGIKLKSPVNLNDFDASNNNTVFDSIINSNRYKIKLLSAEIVYEDLYLYTEGIYNNPLVVNFFDSHLKVLQTIKVSNLKPEVKVKLSASIDETHHIQLFDATGVQQISNKILLTDYISLAKTHPNPKAENIEGIYNDIQNGDLSKVLDLLNYAILDDAEDSDLSETKSSGSKESGKPGNNQGSEKIYDLSTYKQIENNSLAKGLLLSSLSLRVLDILKFIRSKEFAVNTDSEIRADEQEDDLGSISGVEKEELNIHRNISLAILKAEKKKLLSYFNDLNGIQQYLVYSDEKPKDYKPTLTDLTKYLIALELLFEYGGKSEKYVDNDRDSVFNYLALNGEEPYYNDNVKGSCLNIIGEFLMLVRSGFKEYDFEYTKAKVQQFKFDALSSSIVCLLNVRWKDDEVHYLKTMLLNCLHYLGDKNPAQFNNLWPELKKNISLKIDTLKHPQPSITENYTLFKKIVIPAYFKTINQLAAKQFNTSAGRGDIIYKSPLGYCYVKNVTIQNEFTLVRPGFMWDDDLEDFLKFTDDEKYHPIKLPSFIIVPL